MQRELQFAVLTRRVRKLPESLPFTVQLSAAKPSRNYSCVKVRSSKEPKSPQTHLRSVLLRGPLNEPV